MISYVAKPQPIKGVIFDFHATLVDARDPGDWIRAAQVRLGRPGPLPSSPEPADVDDLSAFMHRIWEHASVIDPASERDLSQAHHRDVFSRTVGQRSDVDPELIDALYAVMADQWVAFDDTLPVLRELKARGLRVALLSNIGLDIRPHLEQIGVADLVDRVVLSYEVGVVKPAPGIFQHALDMLGLAAGETLMVGDSWHADAGAAALGIRTLILPRTLGPVHGLDAVLRLVGETAS
jgi:HAD superfamily hydrolase (TIGR01509 family)